MMEGMEKVIKLNMPYTCIHMLHNNFAISLYIYIANRSFRLHSPPKKIHYWDIILGPSLKI